MDESTSPSDSSELAEPVLKPDREPLRRQIVELLVVLCIAVIPDILTSVGSLLMTADELAFDGLYYEADGLFLFQTLSLVGRSICVIAAVLYIMHTAPEPFTTFGFRKPRWVFDIGAGFTLFLVSWGLYWGLGTMVAMAFYYMGIEPSTESPHETGVFAAPSGSTILIQTVVFSAFNGFAEQLVITAYLVTRVRGLFGTTWPAIVIATTLFASYHTYQGFWGVFSAAIFGLLATTAFAFVRRIWLCVVAHFLGDLVPTLLAAIDYPGA